MASKHHELFVNGIKFSCKIISKVGRELLSSMKIKEAQINI